MRPNAEEGRIEQICLTDKTFDYEVRRHFDLGSDLHHCSGAVMDKSTLKLSVVTQNGLKRARGIGSFISKKKSLGNASSSHDSAMAHQPRNQN